ncbi:PAS domain-containing sensor histidine kinase [Nocardioides bruguierae]|uniref:PAS domain-containing sensor histidine kinase n=1 Tax=Nocardioides bruguierae TaxID=2945102 RepID=UPI0020215826|nr:PAS domain-containing sensor histidine kinase [Nocardioides bruguierae]MCL8024397.1 PAS domain-containing sensor histidine kinase [Nocardioides bruguierae]
MHDETALPSLERLDWAAQIKDYAIITLDPRGLVTSWNEGAVLVKGWSAPEIIGRSFETFYPPEDVAAGLPHQLLALALAEGRTEHLGWRVRRDGTRFWGDVVITAVHDDNGQHTGFVKVTRDLTEQRAVERARETFIAGLGHDFRSPLTSIEGYAQLLASDLDDPVLVDFAQRIRSNAKRVMGMVEQLVEQAKLRTGTVEIEPEPVDLGAFLPALVGDLGGVLRTHEVVVEPCEGVYVLADPDALRRVLTNVLTNAAKYSPRGSRVDVVVTPAAEAMVDVVVADRGRGIAEGDREAVFGEFERGTRAERDGGFGLGLAVVRQLCELMGGTARADAGRHGGTDLIVTLSAV